jgi:molybdate transport system regulatory protein
MIVPPARLGLSLWIETPDGEILFGQGRLTILEAIEKHGSLTAAADALGMSYRGLWARIRRSEQRLGLQLVESHAGRGPSSGTRVTHTGKELMHRYRDLRQSVLDAAEEAFRRFADPGPQGP